MICLVVSVVAVAAFLGGERVGRLRGREAAVATDAPTTREAALDVRNTHPITLHVDRTEFLAAGGSEVLVGQSRSSEISSLTPFYDAYTHPEHRLDFHASDMAIDTGPEDHEVLWVIGQEDRKDPEGGPFNVIHRRQRYGPVTEDTTVLSPDARLSDVIVAFGTAWVVDVGRERLLRMDPATASVASEIRTDGPIAGLAASEDALWALVDGEVVRVDPEDDSARRMADLPVAHSLASVGGHLWAATSYPPSLIRLDPKTGRTSEMLPVDGGIGDLLASKTNDRLLWGVGGAEGRTLFRIEASSGKMAQLPVPDLEKGDHEYGRLHFELAAFRSLWFVDKEHGEVVQFRAPREMEPYRVDRSVLETPVPTRLADGTEPPRPPDVVRDAVDRPVVVAKRVPPRSAAQHCRSNGDPWEPTDAFVSPDGFAAAATYTDGPARRPALRSCDARERDGEGWIQCGEGSGEFSSPPTNLHDGSASSASCATRNEPIGFCTISSPTAARWTLVWHVTHWVAYPVRPGGLTRVTFHDWSTDMGSDPIFVVDLDEEGQRIDARNVDCFG